MADRYSCSLAMIIPSIVRFTILLRLVDQSIVGYLTGHTCYPGTVISLRQLSRSSISPCEQVGEHHGDAGGCLPRASSGIRGGATDGGGELDLVVAQPPASSTNISSGWFFMGMKSSLLLRPGSSLLFIPRAALTQHLGQPVAAVTGC